MNGLRDPSFFPTKNNPAPAGEDEGRIRPDVLPHGLFFRSRNGVQPALRYGGAWDQFNGAVVWTMRGKRQSLGLAEDFLKVMVTGGDHVQVRVLGVCGRVGRKQVNFCDILLLHNRGKTVCDAPFPPLSDLAGSPVNMWVVKKKPGLSQNQRVGSGGKQIEANEFVVMVNVHLDGLTDVCDGK